MILRKTPLLLPVAGLLAGLGLSCVVPARYTATAVVALSETATEPGVPEIHRALAEFFSTDIAELLSSASLSMLLQAPRGTIFRSEQDRLSALARTRTVIRIDVMDLPSPAQSAYRLSYTGKDEEQARDLVNAMITRLIQGHSSTLQLLAEEQDKALRTEIADLKSRLAALEDRVSVKSGPPVHPAVIHDISPE